MVAAGVLVTAVSLMAHEAGHALAASARGAGPMLVTSTSTEGEWSRLDETGILLLGVGGTLANAILALVGWLGFRRRIGRPSSMSIVFWLFFATNTWIPVVHLIASPIFEFGDWMLIIDRFPNRGPMRASFIVTGLFLAGVLWKGTVVSLARLVGNGPAAVRRSRALRVVWPAWVGGGLVSVVAGLLAPVALVPSVVMAAGGTLGSVWPVLLAARGVGENPVPGAGLQAPRSMLVIGAAAAAGALLIALFGPGLQL